MSTPDHLVTPRGRAGATLVAALVVYSALQPAHAYVDPGTGAMMLQLAAAALAGVAFYFRSFRDWLGSLLHRGRGSAAPAAEPGNQPDDQHR